MAGRNQNGEGTIYRRKDGRYEGAVYLYTASGMKKRHRVYGKTRAEAHEKLVAAKAKGQQGVRLPDRIWKLGDYFDYWLEQVVRPNLRPRTYETYAQRVRLNLKPGLGTQSLTNLNVRTIQTFFNAQIAAGHSVRMVHMMREVLSSALARAEREELVTRNVARLVSLPSYERQDIQPWTQEEAKRFLEAAKEDPLYSAFVLLTIYGLRLGEVLGIRWCDVDESNRVIHVRQQLQRTGGALRQGAVKTHAGRRDLPIASIVTAAIALQRDKQTLARTLAGDEWQGTGDESELLFTTRSGLPIEPRNFVRSFHRINQTHDIRDIKVHHVRHTAATLLKKIGVPARDAQLILGHSQITTTQQIYQHGDMESRTEALEKVNRLFLRTAGGSFAVNFGRQIRGRPVLDLNYWLEPTEGFEPTTRCLQSDQKGDFQRIGDLLKNRRRQRLLGLIAVASCRQNLP